MTRVVCKCGLVDKRERGEKEEDVELSGWCKGGAPTSGQPMTCDKLCDNYLRDSLRDNLSRI